MNVGTTVPIKPFLDGILVSFKHKCRNGLDCVAKEVCSPDRKLPS